MVAHSSVLQAWEGSLAHRRVLFLYELPEFNKSVLEVMRQPLKAGGVTMTLNAAMVDFKDCVNKIEISRAGELICQIIYGR